MRHKGNNIPLVLLLSIGLIHSNWALALNNDFCRKEQLQFYISDNLGCFFEREYDHRTESSPSKSNVKKGVNTKERNDLTSKCWLQQEILAKKSICFLLPLQTCFDDNWTLFAYDFFSLLLKTCSDSILNQTFILTLPERQRNAVLTLLERRQERIANNIYKESCSKYDRSISTLKILSCTEESLGGIVPFFNLDLSEQYSGETIFPTICDSMHHTLNSCFRPNMCYSETEMASLKNSMLIIYSVYIKGLLKFYQNVKFQNDMKDNSILNKQLDTSFYEDRETKYIKDHISSIAALLEEYERGKCDWELEEVYIVESPFSYFYQKWFTIPLILVSLVITCYLLVQCTKASHA